MKRYSFDCETDGLLDTLTVIHSLVLRDLDTDEVFSANHQPGAQLSVEDAVRLLMEADEIVGHNIIKFDLPAIRKVYRWFKPKGRVIDTLILVRLIYTMVSRKGSWVSLVDYDQIKAKLQLYPGRLIGSHTLEAWGQRLGEWKGDYATVMIERGLDPWAQWNPEMQAYCEQDVVVTTKLYRRILSENYSQQAMDLEHDFATIIALQEQFGFQFNEVKAAELYGVLIKKRQEIAAKLVEAFPPKIVRTVFVPKVNNKARGYQKGVPFTRETTVEFNPSSRQMIGERLKELGWEPTEFTPNGQPKVDETILSALPWPEAQVLAEHFLIEKRIGQLAEGDQAWLRLVRHGRIHGSVNTNGAVTGRCTHSKPNVTQVPGVGAPYGEECRSLFESSLGVLVGADASGLELRCLAHFMARYDDGAYGKILLEGDIHWANVMALGLVPEGTVRDEDRYPIHKLFRGGAKTFIYGFLYGAGDAKAGSIVLDIAMREVRDGLGNSVYLKYFPAKTAKGYTEAPTEAQLKSVGKRLKKSFLDKTPALKQLREAVQAAAQRGYLVGIDGRKLYVRSPHAALNTLLQSAGALIVKQATVFAYRKLSDLGLVFGKDYALVAHVHDEMQVDCRTAIIELVKETLVNAFRATTAHFNFRCPIDGEAKHGNNWCETH